MPPDAIRKSRVRFVMLALTALYGGGPPDVPSSAALLIEDVFPGLDRPGRQPQGTGNDRGQRQQADQRRRLVAEDTLKQRGDAAGGHGVGHQRLDVMGYREPSEVARHEQRHLLPPEHEEQARY